MLHSLSCNKYNVLLKTGDRTKIAVNDDFKVNEDFTSKLLRFIVPVPTEKDTFIKEKVEADRSFAIDAAIVKLLKTRKRISHLQLMQDVINILQTFKPNPRLIKERIENLIT